MSHLSDDLQAIRLHYAQHADPDNPTDALLRLSERWNENEPHEDPPPVEHVDHNTENSAASSLTDHRSPNSSPARKKQKPGEPGGDASTSAGKKDR